MARIIRRFRLAVLVALLLAALPAARPTQAQSFVVSNLTDVDNNIAGACGGDGCSLREAIRLANETAGANTITFSVTGEIAPQSELPQLTDDATTIDAGTSHAVAINGSSAGDANGLIIRSSNNVIRGLVIYNFANSLNDDSAGMGIVINGAALGALPARGDNNRLYGNWIGISPAGSAALSNRRYGVFISNGASNNIIGADSAADRNVISGNRAGGIRLVNTTTLGGLVDGNSIVGNYIGTATTGEALPAGLDAEGADSGIGVSNGSRNTLISNNVIGGFNSSRVGAIAAGINLTSQIAVATSDQIPAGTTITGNYIGVSRAGVRLANRIGVRVGDAGVYGPNSTTIGGADAAARNIIAGNGFRGIEMADTGFAWGDVTVANNYVGLDGSGTRQPNGWSTEVSAGAGIYIGRIGTLASAGRVTVGPGNVVSANVTYGLWVRTGNQVIKGNFFGTNPTGTSSTLATTANGSANIFLENGNGVTVGGPTPADRNIIAFSGGATGGVAGGILINPLAAGATNCSGAACVSGGHTIEGNYIGVAVDGVSALNTASDVSGPEARNKEGIRLRTTANNLIRNNVIGGLNQGITLGSSTAGSEVTGTTISGNRIGAPASGEIFFASYPLANQIVAPRNLAEGIRLFRGSGNTISANLVAYNAAEENTATVYGGIRIGSGTTAASNNVVEDNRVVRNGESGTYGIVVDTSTGVRLSRNTTQYNAGDRIFSAVDRGGIFLFNGGNGNRAAPTGLAVSAGNLTGASSCNNCTVEVFTTSQSSEAGEGPVYLTAGTTNGSGAFSVPLTVCQRYLTATVTDASGNTSPFSALLDSGNPGPCQPLVFSLSAAANPSRNVAPGATTVYTHTISHSAPVALTYTVVFTSSRDWASAPALVTVPANGSADFAVSVRVPEGTLAGSPADLTDVQVFAGVQGSNVVRDTTTPQVATVNPAQPAVSGPLTEQRTGATVTFNHTITNTGDLIGTFLVSTPTFVGSVPSGWNIASVTPQSVQIGPGATSPLAIVVNTPTGAPPTVPVTLTFQVSVQGASPPAVVTQSDFIVTPVSRSFSFTPNAAETASTPAGSSLSFSYTLTNTGNAADSFSVVAAPPLPVVAPPLTAAVTSAPSLANLPAGATAAVTVTYSVPSGTLEGAYTSVITASATGGASPPAPQTRNVTVNVTGGGALAIAPGLPSLDPVSPVAGGTAVTFTNTLTNTGNAAARVAIGPVTGTPAGWSSSVITTTCPSGTDTLAAGATCTFVVEAIVPEGAPGGPVDLGISATAFNNPPTVPDVTATAVNTVNVAVVRSLELAPDGLAATVGPGQVVTFTHTLTNTGNAPDSFDLTALSSDSGWTVSVSPTVVSALPVNTPRTVVVSAQPGPTIIGGASTTLTLTATGQGGGPSKSVTDTATLDSIVGGDLSAGGRRNVDAGGTVAHVFTVLNTGTTPVSYTVDTADSAAGWSSAASDVPTLVVQPGLTATLTVSVTAPLAAAPSVTNTTTVRLFVGDGSGAPLDTSTAVTGIGPAFGVLLSPENAAGDGRPNTTVVLTHTLTNLGSEQGSFQLSADNSLGWQVEVSPDLVSLAPGASLPVQVRVSVKPSAEAGARNFIGVRAELVGDETVFDTSLDTVDVPLVVGLTLSSSQVRGVQPGVTTSLDSLTVFNSGSAYDFFSLVVTGEDANWDVILGQSVVGVNTGDPARVSVKIRVGAGVDSGTVRNLKIEARSSSDGTVRASVDLVLTALGEAEPPLPPARLKTYLPQIQR